MYFPMTLMLILSFAAIVVSLLVFFILVLLLLRLIEYISGCEIVKPFMAQLAKNKDEEIGK